jgi:branched-chain amino acid transport system substrate-binding protein
MPVFDAFKLWVDQVKAGGVVEVKAFGKKIPIKLIAHDDQSSTATPATLHNQLITQDQVDLLAADSGSVLTSVGMPIAREVMFGLAPRLRLSGQTRDARHDTN